MKIVRISFLLAALWGTAKAAALNQSDPALEVSPQGSAGLLRGATLEKDHSSARSHRRLGVTALELCKAINCDHVVLNTFKEDRYLKTYNGDLKVMRGLYSYAESELWRIHPDEDETVKIQHKKTGQYLRARNLLHEDSGDGNAVDLANLGDTCADLLWRLIDNHDGSFAFKSVLYGGYLRGKVNYWPTYSYVMTMPAMGSEEKWVIMGPETHGTFCGRHDCNSVVLKTDQREKFLRAGGGDNEIGLIGHAQGWEMFKFEKRTDSNFRFFITSVAHPTKQLKVNGNNEVKFTEGNSAWHVLRHVDGSYSFFSPNERFLQGDYGSNAVRMQDHPGHEERWRVFSSNAAVVCEHEGCRGGWRIDTQVPSSSLRRLQDKPPGQQVAVVVLFRSDGYTTSYECDADQTYEECASEAMKHGTFVYSVVPPSYSDIKVAKLEHNDEVSYAVAPRGWCLRLYEHYHLAGYEQNIGSTSEMTFATISNHFKDEASSFLLQHGAC